MTAPALADVYVRHAMAVSDPDLPPSRWDLGAAGRAAAKDLAARLEVNRPVAALITSPEPKAVGTAEPIAERFGVDLHLDDRLVEARRPWVGKDYRAVAHRYLNGEEVDGWEDRGEVAARVGAAVRAVRAAGPPDAASIVVGHGLALCLHLGPGLPAGFDLAAFWARLAFPDAWVVEREDLVLRRSIA